MTRNEQKADPVIREATTEDLAQLRGIYYRARKLDFHWVDPSSIKISDFDQATEGEFILAAFINNQAAGFLSIWEPDNFIHNLFVDPNCRHIGIGRALIKEALSRCKGPMTLKCVKENRNALSFYSSMGWQIVKEETGSEIPYYLLSSKTE